MLSAEKERLQLKCLLSSCSELAERFVQLSSRTASPQLKTEYEKLAASALDHASRIQNAMGDGANG